MISGLKGGKIIIQKPNIHLSDSEKHNIVQNLVYSGCTKQEIWEKYIGQPEEHGQLLHPPQRKRYAVAPSFNSTLSFF